MNIRRDHYRSLLTENAFIFYYRITSRTFSQNIAFPNKPVLLEKGNKSNTLFPLTLTAHSARKTNMAMLILFRLAYRLAHARDLTVQ